MTGHARAPASPRPEDWRPTSTLETLRLRADLLTRARAYFAATDALEVETPALVRAPVTDVHIDALRVVDDAAAGTTSGFLQTSPEYAMKRLLCAGAPDIYQVCHVFRAAERGRRHNPEFTMIEWYRRGLDHHALMRDVEALVRSVLAGLREPGTSVFVSYRDAFRAVVGLDPLDAPIGRLVAALERRELALPESMRMAPARDDILDLAMGTVVAASFASDRLTFLYDFPASQAALAQVRGPVASRFEAFWGPLELANGFHELGAAAEQRARFEADIAQRRANGQPDRDVDERFLAALSHGLPPCAGVALGFDRLVMVAAGAASIDEVLTFPFERA
ncbi:MAG TPA: EF-P lysine aminoacylase EpmA [Steroidobacteraceae bacterium]|nr:EF-P lysine aminoacylase EpmA [Steroidobacteraceae bacterium]